MLYILLLWHGCFASDKRHYQAGLLIAWSRVTQYYNNWQSSSQIRKMFTHFIKHIHLFEDFIWWRHQMETFSALLTLGAGNSPVTGEFPAQRPVTRSFDVLFDLRLNKRLSKQPWGWWFETTSCSLWHHPLMISVHHQYCQETQTEANKESNNNCELCPGNHIFHKIDIHHTFLSKQK